MSCRGNIYSPPSSLTLGSAVSHFSYSSFSQLLCSIFLPFLKYLIREAPPATLGGSALTNSESILQLAGTSCVQPWVRLEVGGSPMSLIRGHPYSHLHLLNLPWKCNTQLHLCKTQTICADQHPALQELQPLQVANQECFPNNIKRKSHYCFAVHKHIRYQ